MKYFIRSNIVTFFPLISWAMGLAMGLIIALVVGLDALAGNDRSGNCSKDLTAKIENYLGSISKSAITFEQETSSGEKAKGILLIHKPHKFRANYDAPHPILIVGGKNFISLYDYDLEEVSRIDAKDNIFKFLLEENLSLSKNVSIEKCVQNKSEVEIDLKHKETDQKARIIFSSSPFAIKALITPEDGNNFDKEIIKISFGKMREMSKYIPELFIIKNPQVYGAPKRYETNQILKMLY